MEIKETTPPPSQRTFSIHMTETELSEIVIAFNHMLELSPQWYTNTQHQKVRDMRDQINRMKGNR